MSGLDTTTHLVYLLSAVCFVIGLHLMNSPADHEARRRQHVDQLDGAGEPAHERDFPSSSACGRAGTCGCACACTAGWVLRRNIFSIRSVTT